MRQEALSNVLLFISLISDSLGKKSLLVIRQNRSLFQIFFRFLARVLGMTGQVRPDDEVAK